MLPEAAVPAGIKLLLLQTAVQSHCILKINQVIFLIKTEKSKSFPRKGGPGLPAAGSCNPVLPYVSEAEHKQSDTKRSQYAQVN